MSTHHGNTQKNKRITPPSDLETMLNDDEALESVEAWLNQQALLIQLASPQTARPSTTLVESPAGWLLRLVLHARAELTPRQRHD